MHGLIVRLSNKKIKPIHLVTCTSVRCLLWTQWDADDGSGSVSGYASYPGGPEVMDFFAPAGKSEVETAHPGKAQARHSPSPPPPHRRIIMCFDE